MVATVGDVSPPAGGPLKPLELVLQVLGVVTIEPGVIPWYFRLSTVLQHINYFCAYLCTTLYLISPAHPFFDKMESFQCFVSLWHMYSQYLNLRYSTDKYRGLVTRAKSMFDQAQVYQNHAHIMLQLAKDTRLAVIVVMGSFAGAVPVSAIMTTSYNIMGGEGETLYMVWDPVPDESWYYTSCLWEGSIMYMSLLSLAASLVTILVHCLHAAGHMRLLQAMLAEDVPDLAACARLHQEILRYVKDIQTYFSGQMFLVVVLSSLQNSMRAYMVMRMASQGDPKVVGASFILLLCMFGPFIVCYSGHLVTDNSEKVFVNAYQSQWYNLPAGDKKSLTIILSAASRTMKLHYRGLLDFSMERYSMVMQATYSYITLLKGADVGTG